MATIDIASNRNRGEESGEVPGTQGSSSGAADSWSSRDRTLETSAANHRTAIDAAVDQAIRAHTHHAITSLSGRQHADLDSPAGSRTVKQWSAAVTPAGCSIGAACVSVEPGEPLQDALVQEQPVRRSTVPVSPSWLHLGRVLLVTRRHGAGLTLRAALAVILPPPSAPPSTGFRRWAL